MPSKERRDAFLAKVRHAQEQAEKSKDASTKDGWLKIAEGYRDLARGADTQK